MLFIDLFELELLEQRKQHTMTIYQNKSVYQDTTDLLLTNEKSSENSSVNLPPFRVFKRRWIILIMYIIYAAVNSFQSFQYAIISNHMSTYYGISSVEVDYMSIIYMVLYMPLVFPASYIMEKKGLRFSALVGCIGTAIGTGIKIFSINQERVWLVYLGQVILSSMVVFIQPLPPKIAAVWFGKDQVSMANGLGVFGIFLGQTLGLFIPPLVVKDHEDVSLIGRDMAYLTYTLAALTILIAIAVIAYFPSGPPEPPSINQVIEKSKVTKDTRFLASLKSLFLDPAFILHSIAFGFIIGACFAIITLFTQEMMTHFPDCEDDIGQIMLCVSICGMVAIVSFGFILDKTRKYNEIASGLSFLVALCLAGYAYALEAKSLPLVYATISALGFFSNAYIISGFELVIELTYPEPEATTTGLLLAVSQTSGALFSLLLGFLLQYISSLWSLCIMIALCFVAAMFTAVLPNRLKRQNFVEFSPVNTNAA